VSRPPGANVGTALANAIAAGSATAPGAGAA
jgi:hypothetical protein